MAVYGASRGCDGSGDGSSNPVNVDNVVATNADTTECFDAETELRP